MAARSPPSTPKSACPTPHDDDSTLLAAPLTSASGAARCILFRYGDDHPRHQRACRDLAAALGRITAKTFVLPISSDKFFPPVDCAAEQALIPGSELRVIEDVHGHASLFGLGADYAKQVDGALTDLLSTSV